ncbi:MAG: FAD-dependent oxidoreductase [Clostridia bacterium]|nr:FAD-dependent oxidoreductase [Clostridia bacterium]
MDERKYDLIIIGAGPSGIFMAYELIKLGSKKKILMIEQGKKVEERFCPIEKTGKCIKCKPLCHITNGFSGAGAFSDGKLSLYNEEDTEIHVGGNLHEYLGIEATKKLIDYTDQIYLDFGADKKIEGLEYKEEVKKIKDKAKKENITLYDVPIRHLGTEKAHELYAKLEKHLIDNGVEIQFNTVVADLIVTNNVVKGVKTKPSKYVEDDEYTQFEKIYADTVVIGVGRKGAKWLSDMCARHNIDSRAGIVDIGVRYELPDKFMADINKYMYEAKFIARPAPYYDKVRTFCQNPSGFVSSEVYDKNITLANGHSYKDRKSTNTNLALLCSHKFSYPFHEPIKYGRNVAENSNQLGNGNILVQRFGDILKGKRTWEKELQENSVVPTLKAAVAGDITYALGYRTMTNIIEFIKMLDKVVPGFAHPDNLLYSPEIKFYSNQVVIDNNFETSIKNLYSIGDGGGLTRGLMMASCSGVHLARIYHNT